jgi:adenylyltransferase/sulfurtransferase
VPSCAEGGVLGVLPGIVGAWQAAEALKLLLEIGNPLIGRLLLVDALDARVREIALQRDPACALCGDRPAIFDVAETGSPAASPSAVPELGAAGLDAWLGATAGARILDVREPHETVLGAPERSIHLPASQLEERMHELDSARSYVVACRIGVKSRWAAQRLWDAGFRRLYHLDGGLLAYAAQAAAFDAF